LLEEAYDKIVGAGNNFRVVFVSSDRTQEEFVSNFGHKHKDFLAIPFGDPHVMVAKQTFSVTGIPSFVVVTKNGNVRIGKFLSCCFDVLLSILMEWSLLLTHRRIGKAGVTS
jgi:hypothetical protein